MIIEQLNIKIRDIVIGYTDLGDEGVKCYNGILDARPPYQREFIYNSDQRNSVITTILNNFPLNVMYWAMRNDNTYEIIDGQQRTLSICQYINGDFSYDGRYFHNLYDDEKEKVLDYELMVYSCTGTPSEKLQWFKIINIAGEKLTNQELRNAVYHGTWLNQAKKYFSKNGCPAYQIGKNYLKGTPIRQDYLETVLSWYSNNNIEDVMAENQHKESATEIWDYYRKVINWVEVLFIKYRREMKGIDWGHLYNTYGNDNSFISSQIEDTITRLMRDDDVQRKSGIYYYIFDKKESHLSIRRFTESEKRSMYEKQNGICNICNDSFDIDEMEGDHIIPWSRGGKTNIDNLQMLCIECNRTKSSN
jgi:hypothetical protein